MTKRNPTTDFIQFIAGGALFGSGGFLLANQVMASSAFSYRGGGWGRYGGGSMFPIGTPGMGLLMIPLGIGVCLLFAGTYKRWANLMIWASLAAIVGEAPRLRKAWGQRGGRPCRSASTPRAAARSPRRKT